MFAHSLLLLVALAPLSTASVSSDVWSVNVGGSGDFVDLQQAVDHALPGDTILLWGPANGHQKLRRVTITKGLTVIDMAPEFVRLDDLHVRDVPAGQSVTLINLSVGEHEVFPWKKTWDDLSRGAGALVENCQGPVVFRGCYFRGGYSEPGGPGVRAVRADVALLDCEVHGGALGNAGTSSTGMPNMQHALVLEDARAFVSGSELRGGSGDFDSEAHQDEIGGRGGDGVRASGDSFLWLLDSDALGGTGWSVAGFTVSCFGGDGGTGVKLGPDARGYARASTVLGGDAGWGNTGSGRDGEAVIGDLASLPGPALRLKAPTWARDVDTIEVVVRGEPGSLAYLAIGEMARFRPAGRGGAQVADGATWLALGPLPPSGKLTVPIPVPPIEAEGAQPLLIQSAFQEATGLVLGEARALVVVDERWLPEGLSRLYVDQTVPAGGDGLSWATAFSDLRQGLEAATGIGPGLTDVWVREGVYRPITSASAPIEPFFVKSRTRLFGGFAGTETELRQRDPALHATVLSGDLLGDDTADDTYRDDNSRVVVAVGPWEPRQAVRLDGLTISAGHNDLIWGSHVSPFQGSGVELHGSVDIVGCTFLDNRRDGPLYAWDKVDLRVVDSRFLGTRADYWLGGFGTCRLGISSGAGQALFAGCEFSGNTTRFGGAIHTSVETRIVNCSFYANEGTIEGGAVFAEFDCPLLEVENSLFWTNASPQDPDIHVAQPGTIVRVNHSLFRGAATSSWGAGNVEGPARLTDPAGADGIPGTLDDDLTPRVTSPAVDAGNNAFLPPDVFDLDGDGDTAEPMPLDVVRKRRQIDDPNVPDSGSGAPPVVDMGSRERQ